VAIDLLNINDRYGFTVAGVGLDAMIGKRVNQSFYRPFLE
jgi:diacylglycerol kinase family enzyme